MRFTEIRKLLQAYNGGTIDEVTLSDALNEYSIVASRKLMFPTAEGCLSMARPAGKRWSMSRLSFGAVECFTAQTSKKWEAALLANNQQMADKFRAEYLAMLAGMGWTEEQRDAEALKYIDEEWINIYRRAFLRLVVPLSIN